MQKKILMLDLEGTITSSVSSDLKYSVRPHAEEFLSGCINLFDKIYMNTCVSEQRTKKVMKQSFPFLKYEYWIWRGKGEKDKKTNGFEKFSDDKVVMVDDGVSSGALEDFKRLGVHYINIKGYGTELEEANENDNELVKTLTEIKKVLGV